MGIQTTEYAEKIASVLAKNPQPEVVKEAAPQHEVYRSIVRKGFDYAKPFAGAYLATKGVQRWNKMNTKQRVGTAAAVMVMADLLANPGFRRGAADAARAVARLPRRRRRITKGDLAVATGLGAAGVLTVNKMRAFHNRATYGADYPAYNTTPVYYDQNSY